MWHYTTIVINSFMSIYVTDAQRVTQNTTKKYQEKDLYFSVFYEEKSKRFGVFAVPFICIFLIKSNQLLTEITQLWDRAKKFVI